MERLAKIHLKVVQHSNQQEIEVTASSFLFSSDEMIVTEKNKNTINIHFLQVPCTTQSWLNIAKGYEDKWNFPNCIGALDVRRVQTQAPHNCESEKKINSIVLMALADAEYKFTYIDVVAHGRDAGVFSR